jgi:hypothetical protein
VRMSHRAELLVPWVNRDGGRSFVGSVRASFKEEIWGLGGWVCWGGRGQTSAMIQISASSIGSLCMRNPLMRSRVAEESS